jgi:hypothetical protein
MKSMKRHRRTNWFRPASEVVRQHWKQSIEEFLAACPEWTRASLLRTAQMDMGLIRRVEGGKSFNIATLDALLAFMGVVVAGGIKQAPPPSQQKGK